MYLQLEYFQRDRIMSLNILNYNKTENELAVAGGYNDSCNKNENNEIRNNNILCKICFDSNVSVVTTCGHLYCVSCISELPNKSGCVTCAFCRYEYNNMCRRIYY